MKNLMSRETIYNNLKFLVFEQNERTVKNLNAIFELAISLYDIDTIKILARNYFFMKAIVYLEDNDYSSDSLIELISMNTSYSVIKDVISQGIYINKKDSNGNTALIIAATLNKVDLVKLLLENDAEADVKSNNGLELIDSIFTLGYKEVLELLIRYGATNVVENYATDFFIDIDKSITSQYIAEQFVYEELDAARYGCDEAIHFAKKSGVKKELYLNAMSSSLKEVDGEKGPQEKLHAKTFPLMTKDNKDLVTKVRILTVEKVMNKYSIGKYEKKITKLTLENSNLVFIHKDAVLIEDERFEQLTKDKFYNPSRKIYLDILYDSICFSTNDGDKKEYFAISNREEILKHDIIHNPKRLVEILSYFTKDNPIKYTAHSFDWNKYGTYERFINEVKQTFEEIEDDLRFLSPNLFDKITKFLFSDNLNSNNTWGMNRISFGWSSPELKDWSSIEESKQDGKKAIYFPLERNCIEQINGRTMTIFEDVCNVFKNEIEIRDDDKLSILIEEIEEDVLGFDFEVEYKNLENISFYTDVEYIRNGLIKIFEQFKHEIRIKYNSIIVEAISCTEGNYTDLFITQVNSTTTKNSNDMMAEVDDGDFQDIKQSFLSLCDWSVLSKFSDGCFEINYLSLESECVIKEEIDKIPEGFTHKLRFYNV